MGLTVAERGRRIATLRFVEVRLMETAAAWIPTTPEMEAKVLLGRHVWDFAQHADALGKRTFELRMPQQHSLEPAPPYLLLLEDLAVLEATDARLDALYEGLLPGLDRRYADYAAQADAILDAPSLVIVERIRQDLARQRSEVALARSQLSWSASAPASDSWTQREARADLYT